MYKDITAAPFWPELQKLNAKPLYYNDVTGGDYTEKACDIDLSKTRYLTIAPAAGNKNIWTLKVFSHGEIVYMCMAIDVDLIKKVKSIIKRYTPKKS